MANIIISNLPQIQELNDNLVTVIEDTDETFKVTLGQLKLYIRQGSAITIDTEMSSSSTNPVQNKVVKAAVDAVASSLASLISSLSAVATSGSYSDLTGVPTNVSTFQNDAGYLTQHQDISGKVNTSDLSNKSLSINAQSLKVNDVDVLTSHQDISGKVNTSDLDNKSLSINAASLKVNDADVLTSHQDISGKQDKSNLTTTLSAQSTNTQYPGALAVWNLIDGLATRITALENSVGGVENSLENINSGTGTSTAEEPAEEPGA